MRGVIIGIEALRNSENNFSFDPLKDLTLDKSANQRGMVVQHYLSRLLGELNYVRWIRETEKDSPEDRHKIDLIVGLDLNQIDVVIPEVFVQAKASTTGVATFKHKVARRLKREGTIKTISREEWMLANRIIILVGALHISRSRKNRWPVTNEEIIASFVTQLRKIDDYERSKIVPSPD